MKRFFEQIGETVADRLAAMELSSTEERIRKLILRYFAENGAGPTFLEIKSRLKLPSLDAVKQVIEKLRDGDILTVREDKITSSYPFSAVETRHKVLFCEGHEVFATCATDAFGIHFLLVKDITILSRCPRCEQPLTIKVKNGRIDSHEPDEIIEFVSREKKCGCNAESLCPFINLFCSDRHLNEWLEGNADLQKGEIFSLQEVVEHGKSIYGDLLNASVSKDIIPH